MHPLLLLSGILQLTCIIHAVRTHRASYWIFILLAGSYLGVMAYVLVELLPSLRHSRTAQKTLNTVHDKIDPERHKRAASHQLEVADTLENRRHLAAESFNSGDYQQAAELYRSGMRGLYATDPDLMLGLARAQFALNMPTETKKTLEDLIAANPDFRSSEGHLLYARCVEAGGDIAAALHEYESLTESFAGEEARVRYALLLKRDNQLTKANVWFETVLKRCRVSPEYYRRAQQEWIEIAKREVAGPR